METEEARKYLIDNVLPKFSDSTFKNYVNNKLAGDFACNLAEAWQSNSVGGVVRVCWEHLKDHAELKNAKYQFLGHRVDDLSKEDLLILIAWLDIHRYGNVQERLVSLEKQVTSH